MSKEARLLGRNPEPNQAIEIANGNLAIRNALIYCDTLDLFDKIAKKHEIAKEKRQELKLSLYNTHFLKQELKTSPTEIFPANQISNKVDLLLNEMVPQIELIKEKRSGEQYGTKEKIITAYRVYRKVLSKKDLNENQKNNLLKVIGYTEEGVKIIKNMATSAKLTGIFLSVYCGAGAIAFQTEFTKNWVNNLPFSSNENNLKIALGVSIAADVLLATANTVIDIKLLRNKSIGTSPNIITTTIYYLLEKFMPLNKKKQNLTMILASIMPVIIEDLIIQPMSPITVKNIAKSAVRIIESLTKYGYLKHKELSENKLNEVK